MSAKPDFRYRIREVAERKGVRGVDLVQRSIGVGQTTIYRLWRGEPDDVRVSTLVKLAQALDVKLCDLIEVYRESSSLPESDTTNESPRAA